MKHLLAIDDDPVLLALLQSCLEDAGYRVSIATDAICSNSIIYGSDPPDLILMDVIMPLMSGDKKVLALKSRDQSNYIPVLLISGKAEDELKRLAGEIGANGYLTKPFKKTALIDAVSACIRGNAA